MTIFVCHNIKMAVTSSFANFMGLGVVLHVFFCKILLEMVLITTTYITYALASLS